MKSCQQAEKSNQEVILPKKVKPSLKINSKFLIQYAAQEMLTL